MAARGTFGRSLACGLAALAIVLPEAARAGETGADGERERPWYVPDHAKLQFAGNIGFLSPGVGYALARRRLEADLFLGWVPEAVGGRDIFSVTGKLTWLPWAREARGWSFHPLTAGLQLTNTFGRNFFVREPDGFPRGYHVLPTALRAGVALGGTAAPPWRGLEQVRFYYELVAVDVMLGMWIRNRSALDVDDVVSLALGARLEF
jgi:hypothetical protein